MAAINLEKMNLQDLKDLSKEVTKAITSFEERRKREALLALEERAREFGFSVSELTGTKISRTRSPAVAKYKNPSNPDETWSGRGRQPRWFSAAMAAGVPEESLHI